jgi:hypothetical protein
MLVPIQIISTGPSGTRSRQACTRHTAIFWRFKPLERNFPEVSEASEVRPRRSGLTQSLFKAVDLAEVSCVR